MKYKVGDLVTYRWKNPEKKCMGIVTKSWKDSLTNMYFVYFFDDKKTYRYREDKLCLISTE